MGGTQARQRGSTLGAEYMKFSTANNFLFQKQQICVFDRVALFFG